MRSREKRVDNTNEIKTENHRLTEQDKIVTEEREHEWKQLHEMRRAVEKKTEEREHWMQALKRARIVQQ